VKLGIIVGAATILPPRPLATLVVVAMQNEGPDIELLRILDQLRLSTLLSVQLKIITRAIEPHRLHMRSCMR
jgi:hypothetical protein